MSLFTELVEVSFGPTYSNSGALVYYSIYDNSNTLQIGPSNLGILEIPDGAGNPNNTGIYYTSVTLNTSWLPARIVWTLSGTPSAVASEVLGENFLSTISGISNPGATVTLPPIPPTNFSATAVGSGDVTCTWTASTDSRLSFYIVQRDEYRYLVPSTQTSFTDSGLIPGWTYRYLIYSANSPNNKDFSTPSNIIAVTVT